VQWNYLEENSFRKVSKPKGREIIPVFFTESDFRLLLSVIEDRDFKELCITALLSGLRLGELLALRWNDIDFTSKVILVRNSETFTTKSRKNRIVPMSEELFRVLGERKENIRFECESVFHNKYGGKLLETTVSHYFKLYVVDAGINNKLHFHSLQTFIRISPRNVWSVIVCSSKAAWTHNQQDHGNLFTLIAAAIALRGK
jgi:integrase